jgi:O-acetyl-ADP-ribose deacetylase (regulator of RNase III)
MTIIEKKGNLLKAEGIIVHGCNSLGQMGAGVAKQIRDLWPQVYENYRDRYESEGLKMGSIDCTPVSPKTCVINGITQEFFGKDKNVVYVDYASVQEVFARINRVVNSDEYKNDNMPRIVNFPLIGCGLANGDWNVISEMIDQELDDDIEKVLWIYE